MTPEDSASPDGPAMDPAIDPGIDPGIDPVISDAVHTVENRFGAPGLRDLIQLAQEELARAEAALRELSEP